MYAKITKSKIDGKTMTALFYDHDKMPIKTVHFGAVGYVDYTVAPHDKEKKERYVKNTKLLRIGMFVCQLEHYQNIYFMGN